MSIKAAVASTPLPATALYYGNHYHHKLFLQLAAVYFLTIIPLSLHSTPIKRTQRASWSGYGYCGGYGYWCRAVTDSVQICTEAVTDTGQYGVLSCVLVESTRRYIYTARPRLWPVARGSRPGSGPKREPSWPGTRRQHRYGIRRQYQGRGCGCRWPCRYGCGNVTMISAATICFTENG